MKENDFNPGDLVYYKGSYPDSFSFPQLGIITRRLVGLGEIYKVFVYELGKEVDIHERCLEKV